MKTSLLSIICLFSWYLESLEYKVEFENDRMLLSKVIIMPGEEVGLHRDEYPHVVIATKGGILRRLESDGRVVDVEFPTGLPILRGVDLLNQFHKTLSISFEPIELMILSFKSCM